MPTILLNESAAAGAPSSLINAKTGELTLETQVMSDFLSHVDFSPVTALKGVDEELVDDENGSALDDSLMTFYKPGKKKKKGKKNESSDNPANNALQFVPGWLVAEAVDLNDLASMFGHYVQARYESAALNGASLEEKARLAVFSGLIEARKKGKGVVHAAPNGAQHVAAQMHSMISRGSVGHGKHSLHKHEAATLAKFTQIRETNHARLKRALTNTNVESFDGDATPVYGIGMPYESAAYQASLREKAQAAVDEAKKGKGKAVRTSGKMAGASVPHGPKQADCGPEMESDGDAPKAKVVNESVALAGSIMKLHEGRKMPVTEAAKT